MAAIFTFLCLHEVGAHHGYARVPYEAWLERLTGTTLEATFGAERNHYDRLVHLAFGLLLSWPIREFLIQTSAVRGRWSYLLPVGLVMASAMAYEVAEWLAVALVAPAGEGADLLGMQGDVWDAQKDMALAASGSMLAMTVAVNLRPEPAHQRQPGPALARPSDQAASA
jgi:putative membrane protein